MELLLPASEGWLAGWGWGLSAAEVVSATWQDSEPGSSTILKGMLVVTVGL